MKRFMSKRVAVVGIAVGLTLGMSGAAFAYFSSIGGGTGSATAGTSTALTISQNTPAITGLTPNGVIAPVNFTVFNPGTGSEKVQTVVVAVTSTSNVGCTAADFNVLQPTALNQDIAAGGSYNDITSGASIQMKDTGFNQDACQGVTVNLSFTSN
jgi:hypothetical protein